MNEVAAFLSRTLSAKNERGLTDRQLLDILNDALLGLGERCLIDYARAYKENPKALLDSFIKYDSIKMVSGHVVKFARRSGLLKELEGKKDFKEWADKQNLEEKWKPVLANFLLILWGCVNE